MSGLTRHFAAWHYAHTSTLVLQPAGQVVGGVPAAAAAAANKNTDT